MLVLSPFLITGTALVAFAGHAAVSASPTACQDALDAASIAEELSELDQPDEQVANASVIVSTGRLLDIPARGQVIALATAMQESGLLNLPYGDRDSLGLFQQRPSQGWGTAEEILEPASASTRFYEALVQVDGWQQLTVAQAAQAVQRSAYPDAYAQWEDLATALQEVLAETAVESDGAACPDSDSTDWDTIPEGTVPEGYAIPASAGPAARTAIVWAMGQLGTPYQWGGTCTDPHGPDPMARCDCSSLVQQAYAHAGVSLTRTTYTQVTEGEAVSPDDIAPGDLVFSRGTAERPEHVGMAIGAGLVIEAPRTGKPVRITPLEDWDVLVVRHVV
ncbi:C40 family peptidase [Streptomyces sp. RFCAC02]|uniref:C40 family peptidase n=1 Tax=Streptomyces sp. RFCAC02 TaxID=2499143 RepID=UPI001F0E0172|nr:C40 family peptidase [Streptomyces sp. RFCAC02]